MKDPDVREDLFWIVIALLWAVSTILVYRSYSGAHRSLLITSLVIAGALLAIKNACERRSGDG